MRHPSIFAWRYATKDDSPALLEIYNETVVGGGHSPTLLKPTLAAMQRMVLDSQRTGWPIWVLLSGAEVAGWALIRPMVWGTELCHRTGDLSIYIPLVRMNGLAALQAILLAYQHSPLIGLDAISCWILGGNDRSTKIARACRLTQWGLLPNLARYGDLTYDVQIWGARFDDAVWVAYMEALQERLVLRKGRNFSKSLGETVTPLSLV